ncbi:MAG TPA: hypothetical protein VJU79_06715 [Candidatus Dormibacteraeota bacterium]|nr:hypothetical protein [Candidatus Dormibacteraeota bacterium]
MIKRLLLLASTLCTAVIVVSFAMFAVEEARAGSTTQQDKVDAVSRPDLTPGGERAREKKHDKVREWVDDANDALTKPFNDVANSSNIWVQRTVPFALAFLLYFVLLRVLAGYAVRLKR